MGTSSCGDGKFGVLLYYKYTSVPDLDELVAFYESSCNSLGLLGRNASGFKGRTGSLAKKLKNVAELVFIDAPHELQFIYQTATTPPPLVACNKKFAWLVSPEFDKPSETGWTIAQSQFDPLQYQNQTEGFDKSLTYLKKAFAEKGPFDGILGFSQGAAMAAAAVCAKQERLLGEIDFRFCVLCSGFTPWPLMEKKEQGSIKCPSLHIFGSQPEKDRQIVTQASSELAGLFDEGCSTVIEHDFGHIIPTKSPYIDEIKAFLNQFV
ncbi:Rhodanese-like domain-containing protein 6 [Raphanus sativus]|nr:Rhodanese-like domain-containing protein 6 [Raphanus sativus]